MSEKQIIKRYLIGTFSLTYFMWGIILIANQFGYLKFGTIIFWPIYAIGGLASTIMGALLSKKSGKVENYIQLIKESFTVRQPVKYYIVVFILFAVSFGIPAIRNEITSKMKWYMGIMYIFYMIFFGGLEEVGWRYTFQPALEKYLPYGFASCITACFWAAWHLPLFFMEGMNKGASFEIFIIGVFGMSFMLGAIYRVTHSLWLCVLFHAMINAFSQVWINSNNITNPLISTCISSAFKILAAVIIVLLHKSYVNRNTPSS
ncbi:MAG: type II CAAX endopeptidase family protein [Bacillota bacterium]|nr:type II CAAX endopeptidase family protein [Bacillota bacterium]